MHKFFCGAASYGIKDVLELHGAVAKLGNKLLKGPFRQGQQS